MLCEQERKNFPIPTLQILKLHKSIEDKYMLIVGDMSTQCLISHITFYNSLFWQKKIEIRKPAFLGPTQFAALFLKHDAGMIPTTISDITSLAT